MTIASTLSFRRQPLVAGRFPGARRSQAARWVVVLTILVGIVWLVSLTPIGFVNALSGLTILGYAAAVVGLRKPVLGLFGVGILCTLDALTRELLLTGGFLRWNTFNYWLLIVIVLNLPLLLSFKGMQFRLLLGLILIIAVQLLYSVDIERGITHLLSVVCSLGVLGYFLKTEGDADAMSYLGVVTGVLAGVGGFAFNLLKDVLPGVNNNALSYFPLTALFSICLSYNYAEGRRRLQLTLLVLASINAGWVFLTSSRGGMFVGACCLFYLLTSMKNISHRTTIIVFSALFAMGLSTQFAQLESDSVYRLHKMFGSEGTLMERTSGRSDIAHAGWNLFLEHPFGIGTGNFALSYAKASYEINLAYGRGSESAAHSGWIKILSENGIVGILLFSGFVFSFLIVGWRRRKVGLLPLGILITVVLCVAFVSTEFQGKGLWLLVAGGMVAMTRGYPRRGIPQQARRPAGKRLSRDRMAPYG